MSRRPPGGGGGGNSGGSKLRMDRQPQLQRISDPSLPVGKRKEIDNVMKKARANNSGDYWDKKLLDIEEKDPNRWRHSGFKKMYIEGDSSSNSGDEHFRENNRGDREPPPRRNPPALSPRSRDRIRMRSRSPEPSSIRRRSPMSRPDFHRRPRSPRSPPRSPGHHRELRRRSPHPSEMPVRRRSRSPPMMPPVVDKRSGLSRGAGHIRPPSPPPKFHPRHSSKSSVSSYSDDPMYSHSHGPPQHHHHHATTSAGINLHHAQRPVRSRSRSVSIPRARSDVGGRPVLVSPPRTSSGHAGGTTRTMSRGGPPLTTSSGRVHSASSARELDEKTSHRSGRSGATAVSAGGGSSSAVVGKTRHIPLENLDEEDDLRRHGKRAKKQHEDPRLARQQPTPAAASKTTSSGNGDASQISKKHKSKGHEKLRARVKIEGEKRKKRHSSSEESEDSSSSEGESIPTFAATTRMTLSERFGKMAQWSVDRSNMDNLKTMRITKDSAGGPLKVMIEEQAVPPVEHPPPRRDYSPAPAGHFPEELALTAPSGLMSWDDVRVRFDYYKSRGYLRDLDLQDYIKWEEWWYKYQEWLKTERYYEFWERQQMRRRRKKVPIAQRLN